jgi:chaperonin GroEL
VELAHLGGASKVIATKDTTTIVDGRAEQSVVDARVAQLRSEIENSDSDFDKEKLKERVAKLIGGVAVIKVGAASEVEMKEIKDRIDDALHATRAAVEEGIVVGGGVALIRASSAIEKVKGLNVAEQAGIMIIKEALEVPLKQIADNAGKSGEVILAEVLKLKGSDGYNAAEDKYEDLIAAGIIDPTKVTRSALQNSASIASMFLTTEAVITEKPEKKEPPHGHDGMGM